jgi:hypothetical protein
MKVVSNQTIFKVNRNLITKLLKVMQRKIVEELVDLINNLLKPKRVILAFDNESFPNKNWLINVFFFLEPEI